MPSNLDMRKATPGSAVASAKVALATSMPPGERGGTAALTALLAFLGAPFEWQLAGMGLFSGILVPVAIRWIRPRFSPKGVAYGTTGTGVEQGRRYQTLKRDFDGATGIKVNGDFYRLRVTDTGETDLPEGTDVIFKQFDGTTAVVETITHKEQ